MAFIWNALVILLCGFILLRFMGKKTVAEMTGLEIITLLAMASVTGHAVAEDGLWKTIVTLVIFVALLIAVQYLAMKFNLIEQLFIGRSTLVIKDGKILTQNLKKLRITVDQLEARLRENGISSFSDVKTGTIEINGMLGYELMRQAKPVTIGELEQILASLNLMRPKERSEPKLNLFDEVAMNEHRPPVQPELE
ncbi:Protein of uncharacterised function (DUF421) [Chlamydia abortus]|uniref:DUF421 domain-containing protein n=1 Tax=Paenibacillus residui TaxID=629724 RepID=A0ABW3DA12_9BACL|nr:YetF domain-containing protein [Aneurinibacillus sp. XH2]SHE10638.1 Protein of uncharacterised function (DUF421) [Chlamydia abortus]